MIKLSVGQLRKEQIDLAGSEPAEILALGENDLFHAEGPMKYHLHVQLLSSGIVVTGHASARVGGECGRCLSPVSREVSSGEFTIYIDEFDEEEIDITEDVRAELLLELPMNILCADDCPGLCPKCGVNLNKSRCDCVVDPAPEEESPWGKLDQLKL